MGVSDYDEENIPNSLPGSYVDHQCWKAHFRGVSLPKSWGEQGRGARLWEITTASLSKFSCSISRVCCISIKRAARSCESWQRCHSLQVVTRFDLEALAWEGEQGWGLFGWPKLLIAAPRPSIAHRTIPGLKVPWPAQLRSNRYTN